MRIYVQWALAATADYVMYDLSARNQIRNLPSKPEPAPSSFPPLDNAPGWVNAINCQGVIFEGYDHYALAYNAAARRATVSGWVDATADGAPFADVWDFGHPKGDPKLGGRMNTDQQVTRYATAGSPQAEIYDDSGLVWRPYAQFIAPAAQATRHGVYMSDVKYKAHRAERVEPTWDQWIGG